MRKPRLLYFVHQYNRLTGVDLHTQMLEQGLADRYDIWVAYPEGETVQLRHAGACQSLPADPAAFPVVPYRLTRTDQALSEIFRLVRPSIIHIQHFLHWPLGLIDRALETHVPVVVSFHDHFALSPQFALMGSEGPDETVSREYSLRIFGADISQFLRDRRHILQKSLARVQALVTVSPYIEQQLAHVFPSRFQRIEYGIVPFQPQPKTVAPARLRFGYLGQLVPMKGWQSLVAAFSPVRQRHPAAELHCWGGDRSDAPDGVFFHGHYRSHELPEITSQIDVGVVPSEFAETHCMVLSELWRGGVPAAVSRIGELANRISDGENGRFFAAGNVEQIRDTLCWFVENDSWRSWKLPQPRLAAEMVSDYDNLYQRVLAAAVKAPVQSDPAPSKALTQADQTPAPLSRVPAAESDTLTIVQACGFLDEGDGVYRLHTPSQALSRIPEVAVIDCHPQHRRMLQLAKTADVLVLGTLDWDLFPLFEQRRAAGKITVLEANDWYFDLQPWNPQSVRWLDRSLQDMFRHCLRLVDGIQTSTDELARRWREMTPRPVAVFPNQLPEVPQLQPTVTRPLTIGWGGSRGHLADWFQLAPTLQRWLDAHPDVRLAVMTHDQAQGFFNLPADRYHFQSLGTLADYCRFLSRLDIGLAPLLPTDFNRGRSDVKFLEYASRGVVGLYADLEPYRQSVKHGRTGMLFDQPQKLLEYLDLLIADPARRSEMRQQAYDFVADQRRLEDHIGDRLAFYHRLLAECRPTSQSAAGVDQTDGLAGTPAAQTHSSAPRPAAATDSSVRHNPPSNRYLRLTPEGPEQALMAATDAPSPAETALALKQLVDEHPHYLAALQQLGRTLNELRRPQVARGYLDRARELAPHSAEVLCEQARACFLAGQIEPARSLLEQAIQQNPHYALPWRYLIRLVGQTARAGKTASLDELMAQLRRWQPANYGLALMALRLYPLPTVISQFHAWLEEFMPGFHSAELAQAGAAFSDALAATFDSSLDEPQVLELLRRAADAWPRSARIADLLSQALALAGETSASHIEAARAEQLRQVALCYRAEFPQESDAPPHRILAANLTEE